jgi:heme/copper-type cytochrome/quinol oxidase subunit 2
VYGNLEKMVGYLRYEISEPINLLAYIVLALGLVTVIVIITVLVLCLRYRRELRRTKNQIISTEQRMENIQMATHDESKRILSLVFA